MRVEQEFMNLRRIFFIKTGFGRLTFETYDDAINFLANFCKKWPDYSLADLQALQFLQNEDDEKKRWLSIALTLAYFIIALKTADALQKLQLAGIELLFKHFSTLSSTLSTTPKMGAPEEKTSLTKGDVATILGDEWAKRNFGDLKDKDWKDKLKIASEPAPAEWAELAHKKQAEKKKVSYPQPGQGGM